MEIISQKTVDFYNKENDTSLTLEEAKLKILNDVAGSYSALSQRLREVETEFIYQCHNEMYDCTGLISEEDYKKLVRISSAGGYKELVIGK